MRCLLQYSPLKRIFPACAVFYCLSVGLYAQNYGGDSHEPVNPDRFENDDTAVSAKDITPGSFQERNFTNAADEDWVRLRITQRGTYDIFAEAADGGLDTFLELYDSNDELVDANDDWEDGWNARLRLVLNPGTYYIKVSTLNSDPIDNSAYVLSVTAR
jgi:hypothetical protein